MCEGGVHRYMGMPVHVRGGQGPLSSRSHQLIIISIIVVLF